MPNWCFFHSEVWNWNSNRGCDSAFVANWRNESIYFAELASWHFNDIWNWNRRVALEKTINCKSWICLCARSIHFESRRMKNNRNYTTKLLETKHRSAQIRIVLIGNEYVINIRVCIFKITKERKYLDKHGNDIARRAIWEDKIKSKQMK